MKKGKEPRARAVMRDFPGLIIETDDHDKKNGSSVDQVNMVCIKQGELISRNGYRTVTFDGSGDVSGTG